MPIITLTTDWGLKDYPVAAVKGTLYGLCPGVEIVDITHQIPFFNIIEAAYTLNSCSYSFPQGTIHIIGLENTSREVEVLAVRHNGQYFLGVDNGIFSLMFEAHTADIVQLPLYPYTPKTFLTLDVMIPAAVALIRGEDLSLLGTPKDAFLIRSLLYATYDENVIRGAVSYIDSFENVVTNISRDLFNRIGKGRAFHITMKTQKHQIKKLCESYGDVANGDVFALFNSQGLLEIGMALGPAASLLGLSYNETIRIEFNDR